MQIDEKAMMLDYIRLALREDVGDGDHTTLACIPASAQDKAVLIAKEGGVIAGLEVAAMVFHEVDSDIVFTPLVEEGQEVAMGDHVFSVEGSSRSILTAERLSLNYFPFEEDGKKALKKRVYEAPDEDSEDAALDEDGYGVDNVVGPDGEEKIVIYVDVVWAPNVSEKGILNYAKKLLKGLLSFWADQVEKLEVGE